VASIKLSIAGAPAMLAGPEKRAMKEAGILSIFCNGAAFLKKKF